LGNKNSKTSSFSEILFLLGITKAQGMKNLVTLFFKRRDFSEYSGKDEVEGIAALLDLPCTVFPLCKQNQFID
jgi:hypothetical protein